MAFVPGQYEVLDADRRLTNLSINLMADQSIFVANTMFPTVAVNQQAGKYVGYNSADFNRTDTRPVADGAPAPLVNFGYNEDSYFCDVYKVAATIGERTMANASAPIQPQTDTLRRLTRDIMLHREKKFFNTFIGTGIWSETLDGTTSDFEQFDASTGAGSPIELITQESTKFALRNYGVRPNKMTISRDVLDELVNHPDIIERIIYIAGSEPAIITTSHLSSLFGMQVVVSDAVYNDAAEGAAADKKFFITGTILMTYAPESAGLMTDSAGFIFSWSNLSGFGGTAVRTEQRSMEQGGGLYLEAMNAYDMKVQNPEMGTILVNVLA